MSTDTLEFAKAYQDHYKKAFNDNANRKFDEWVQAAKINVAENRKDAGEYRATLARINQIKSRLSKYRTLRVICILLSVIAIIGSLLGFLNGNGDTLTVIISAVVFLIPILLLFLVFKKINPILRSADEEKEKEEAAASKLYKTCMTQLAPLFAQYKDSATQALVCETVPLISLDPNFDVRRFDLLSGKYGLKENTAENESTVGILSGEILGNPFIEERRLRQKWRKHRYEGSLVIQWTEVKRDKDGHLHTVHRSETLHAHVEKPEPYYDHVTRMIFASEACPDLTFLHEPSHAEKLSEKELDRRVKNGEKELRKKEKEAVQSGKTFNALGDTEFDVLFGALNRTHEVQFRLMFTPLARKNMLFLQKMQQPFGDDFYFRKDHMLNIITSEHAQNWNFDVSSERYQFYDVDLCRNAFTDYNNTYFMHLYFELAPLMSVPIYQQHKPVEYIYKNNYARNYTSFEADTLVNALDPRKLKHEKSDTEAILKTALQSKSADEDRISVKAYSFRADPVTEYVSVHGGDGAFHSVPVPTFDYIPLEKESAVSLVGLKEDVNASQDLSSAIKHNLRVSLLPES